MIAGMTGTTAASTAPLDPPLVRRLQTLIPCLLVGPLVVAVVSTVVGLVQLSHPDLGWTQAIAVDARAVATGHSLYGDPGSQYTGMLYTPPYPMLLAPLYRLVWWDGWLPLASMGASLGLAALAGAVAASGGSRTRIERAGAAVGVGAVAWWLVSANRYSMIFDGRTDQLPWLFALAGLVLLARSAARGVASVWVPVLLLSAAFWTKQTAVGGLLAAVIVSAWWARAGILPWRRWWRLSLTIVAVNLAAAGALIIWSGGWLGYFLLEMPARHHSFGTDALHAAEMVRALLIPVLVAGVAAYGLRGTKVRGGSFSMLLLSALGVFMVVQLVPAWLGHVKQGGSENQYIGIVWALGLVVAVAHRESGSERSLLTSVAVYATVVLVAVTRPAVLTDAGIFLPPIAEGQQWETLSPEVVDYSTAHLTYLPTYGTTGREVWPTEPAIADLLAAGERPGHLVDAIRSCRFDAIEPFDADGWAGYISMSGRTDPAYLAELNELIGERYEAGANGAPAPLLGRTSDCTARE